GRGRAAPRWPVAPPPGPPIRHGSVGAGSGVATGIGPGTAISWPRSPSAAGGIGETAVRDPKGHDMGLVRKQKTSRRARRRAEAAALQHKAGLEAKLSAKNTRKQAKRRAKAEVKSAKIAAKAQKAEAKALAEASRNEV